MEIWNSGLDWIAAHYLTAAIWASIILAGLLIAWAIEAVLDARYNVNREEAKRK